MNKIKYYFNSQLVNVDSGVGKKWSIYIIFYPFFSKIKGGKWKKIYYWIKFHDQIGYKWPISDQKVTNCSFDFNMLRNLLVSWWKCSWSKQPTVGQNDQHLVKNNQHLSETILVSPHSHGRRTIPECNQCDKVILQVILRHTVGRSHFNAISVIIAFPQNSILTIHLRTHWGKTISIQPIW